MPLLHCFAVLLRASRARAAPGARRAHRTAWYRLPTGPLALALMHIPIQPHPVAGQAGHNGALEWWDVDDMQLLSANEHFMAVELEWDPTGQTGGADDGSARAA